MSRFNFCGPSYKSQNLSADAQICMNLYPEVNESRAGKAPIILNPSPGLKLFTQLDPTGPVRGAFTNTGRCFEVIAGTLWEIFANGTKTNRGSLTTDSAPVSITGGPTQLTIVSAGKLYVYDMGANTLTQVAAINFNGTVFQTAFIDGFFLALLVGSNQFQWSSLEDASTWDISNINTVSLYPDNVLSMFVDHREIWLFGPKAIVIYFTAGGVLNPFDVAPGGFIEQGIIAPWSVAKCDNSIFWLGGDDRGSGIVWRAAGYTPVRVSNHAFEAAIQKYSRIDDAIAYSFQMAGHSFYHLYFPAANKSWRYDASTGMWHEVGFLLNGVQIAHHSQCHTFSFGKHLVGDWSSGNVYDMSDSYYDDAGQPIKRERAAPYISTSGGGQWIYFSELELLAEGGLGVAAGQGSDPKIYLTWSDDNGHTWKTEKEGSLGRMGEYRIRIIWRRLGRVWGSRGRIFKIVTSEPIPIRFTDSDVTAYPGRGKR